MHVLSFMILLATLILPSGHTSASPSSDNSAKELPTFGEAAAARQIEISKIDLPTLQRKAAQGDAEAQYNLGDLYNFGNLVPQDDKKARQWFEKAAAQGYAGAQNDLGTLYANGSGVPRDDVRAYMWISLAEAHSTGNSKKYAAINLGFLTHRMTPAQIAEAQRLSQQCQAQQFKGC
jgi:TPR repeat protein